MFFKTKISVLFASLVLSTVCAQAMEEEDHFRKFICTFADSPLKDTVLNAPATVRHLSIKKILLLKLTL
jgi:hypothetical protein